MGSTILFSCVAAIVNHKYEQEGIFIEFKKVFNEGIARGIIIPTVIHKNGDTGYRVADEYDNEYNMYVAMQNIYQTLLL